jgi:hypothetical protein
MKFLNVPLDQDLYRTLKVTAAEKDLTIMKIIEEAVKDVLVKYGKKNYE